jgi:hypothetical protein
LTLTVPLPLILADGVSPVALEVGGSRIGLTRPGNSRIVMFGVGSGVSTVASAVVVETVITAGDV